MSIVPEVPFLVELLIIRQSQPRPCRKVEEAIEVLIKETDKVKIEKPTLTPSEISELYHRYRLLAEAIDRLGDTLLPCAIRPDNNVVSEWRFGSSANIEE